MTRAKPDVKPAESLRDPWCVEMEKALLEERSQRHFAKVCRDPKSTFEDLFRASDVETED